MTFKDCLHCRKSFRTFQSILKKGNGVYCSKRCSMLNKPNFTVTHKMTGTRFYNIWRSMKKRCIAKTSSNYAIYGGRGIKLLWPSFEDFKKEMYESYLTHVIEHGEKNTSIERRDNGGHYLRSNCRWATKREQANNRRTSRMIEYKGVNLTLADLCRKTKTKYSLIQRRLGRGWDLEAALTMPVKTVAGLKGIQFIPHIIK